MPGSATRQGLPAVSWSFSPLVLPSALQRHPLSSVHLIPLQLLPAPARKRLISWPARRQQQLLPTSLHGDGGDPSAGHTIQPQHAASQDGPSSPAAGSNSHISKSKASTKAKTQGTLTTASEDALTSVTSNGRASLLRSQPAPISATPNIKPVVLNSRTAASTPGPERTLFPDRAILRPSVSSLNGGDKPSELVSHSNNSDGTCVNNSRHGEPVSILTTTATPSLEGDAVGASTRPDQPMANTEVLANVSSIRDGSNSSNDGHHSSERSSSSSSSKSAAIAVTGSASAGALAKRTSAVDGAGVMHPVLASFDGGDELATAARTSTTSSSPSSSDGIGALPKSKSVVDGSGVMHPVLASFDGGDELPRSAAANGIGSSGAASGRGDKISQQADQSTNGALPSAPADVAGSATAASSPLPFVVLSADQAKHQAQAPASISGNGSSSTVGGSKSSKSSEGGGSRSKTSSENGASGRADSSNTSDGHSSSQGSSSGSAPSSSNRLAVGGDSGIKSSMDTAVLPAAFPAMSNVDGIAGSGSGSRSSGQRAGAAADGGGGTHQSDSSRRSSSSSSRGPSSSFSSGSAGRSGNGHSSHHSSLVDLILASSGASAQFIPPLLQDTSGVLPSAGSNIVPLPTSRGSVHTTTSPTFHSTGSSGNNGSSSAAAPSSTSSNSPQSDSDAPSQIDAPLTGPAKLPLHVPPVVLLPATAEAAAFEYNMSQAAASTAAPDSSGPGTSSSSSASMANPAVIILAPGSANSADIVGSGIAVPVSPSTPEGVAPADPTSSPPAAATAKSSKPPSQATWLEQWNPSQDQVMQTAGLLVLGAAIMLPLLVGAWVWASNYVKLDPVVGVVGTGMGALVDDAYEIIMERCSVMLNKWSYSNLLLKILFVLVSCVPIVVTFGTAYKAITGVSYSAAYLKIYSVINRQPGTNMVSEKSRAAFLILNTAFYVGLFTFAIFLGVVSDEVKSSLRSIKDGKYPLRQHGHVVICNWNQNTISLLRQFSFARKCNPDPFYQRPIAVLANMPKSEMDEIMADRLRGYDLEVTTRSGSPCIPRDLHSVAASKAHTVIVMHPDHASCPMAREAAKAATAMALATAANAGGNHVTHQNVVFQMPVELSPDTDYVSSFGHAGADDNVHVLRLSDHFLTDRFACHAACMPGMLRVWNKIIQQGPGETCCGLKIRPLPELLYGRTFQEVRRAYNDAIVLGYKRGLTVVFEHSETFRFQEGDEIVFLSYTADPQPHPLTEHMYMDAAPAATERLRRSTNYNAPPRKVILAGWRLINVPEMCSAFACLAPEGSSITLILPEVPENAPERIGGVRFRYVQSAQPTSLKALQEAGIKTADSVLLGSPDNVGDGERDAMVLAGMLQVQDAVVACGRQDAPHVVAKVHRFSSMAVARDYFAMLNSNSARAAAARFQSITPAEAATAAVNTPAAIISTATSPAAAAVAAAVAGGNMASGAGAALATNTALTAPTPEQSLMQPSNWLAGFTSPVHTSSLLPAPLLPQPLNPTADDLHNIHNEHDVSTAQAASNESEGGSVTVMPAPSGLPIPLLPSLALLPGFMSAAPVDVAATQGTTSTSLPIPGGISTGSSSAFTVQLPSPVPPPVQSGGWGMNRGRNDKPPQRMSNIISNPEIFTAGDVISALLTQVAEQPNYTLLINQLLATKEGVEMYLRAPALLNIAPNETMTFAEVAEAARQLRQTAVGYVKANGACYMVPRPSETYTFEEGDQVIVFAEDYRVRKK